MRRSYIIVIAVVVLAAAGYFFLWPSSASRAGGYRTEAVTRGDIKQTVSANGTLTPVKVVNVGAQISGRIAALHADFNDKVTSGELLAELDDALLKAQLAQSMAQLGSAKAQVTLAQVTYDRAKDLAARGSGAKADLDNAAAQLEIAQAAVAAAQAKVDIDQVNLGYTKIASPVSGVVMSRDVDVGQTVAASLSAPQIFSIAQDLAQMQINTTVAEADVGAIKEGMGATFRVDAFPGRVFQAKVRQVRLNATTESNVVSYNVVLDVNNADLTLLPGMTTYVQIAVADTANVLRVPNAALRFKPQGGGRRSGGTSTGAADVAATGDEAAATPAGPTVYVLDGTRPKAVAVQTALSDGKVTAITGGELNEGDQVITGLAVTDAPASSGTQRGGGPRLF